MKHNSFLEYMNSKGKIEKPVVDASGDRIDPKNAPTSPKGGKPYGGKDAKKPKMKGGEGGEGGEGFAGKGPKDLIYKPAEGGKSPKLGGVKGPKMKGADNGKGFAGLGPKDLIYKPSDHPKKVKIPTVESRNEMLPILRESVAADPQFIQYVINELKQNGLLGILVGELLDHTETYKHMAEVMAHPSYGPKVRRRLNLAIEEVGPPFEKQVIAGRPDAPEGKQLPADEEDTEDNSAEGAEGEAAPETPDTAAQGQPPVPPAPQAPAAPQMMRKW